MTEGEAYLKSIKEAVPRNVAFLGHYHIGIPYQSGAAFWLDVEAGIKHVLACIHDEFYGRATWKAMAEPEVQELIENVLAQELKEAWWNLEHDAIRPWRLMTRTYALAVVATVVRLGAPESLEVQA